MISSGGGLELPAEVTLQAGDERRHRLIRRASLHLVVIAPGLLAAPAAVHDDTCRLLLGVSRLLLFRGILHDICPPLGVL